MTTQTEYRMCNRCGEDLNDPELERDGRHDCMAYLDVETLYERDFQHPDYGYSVRVEYNALAGQPKVTVWEYTAEKWEQDTGEPATEEQREHLAEIEQWARAFEARPWRSARQVYDALRRMGVSEDDL